MKRLLFVLTILLVLITCSNVSAKEYEFSKRNIKFNLPERYFVITEENYLEESSYNYFMKFFETSDSFSKESYIQFLNQYFESYGMWFMALDLENNSSLIFETVSTNFKKSDLTYNQMLDLKDTLINSFEKELGIDIYSSDVIEINNIAFLEVKYVSNSIYTNHYYLIHNGYGYNFIFESNTPLVSAKCEEVLSNITISDYDYSGSKNSREYLIIVIGVVCLIIGVLAKFIIIKRKRKGNLL